MEVGLYASLEIDILKKGLKFSFLCDRGFNTCAFILIYQSHVTHVTSAVAIYSTCKFTNL